eukprot:g48324.t1
MQIAYRGENLPCVSVSVDMIQPCEAGENGAPEMQTEEKLLLSEAGVELYLEPKKSQGTGHLYVTSKSLHWVGSDKKGYSIGVPCVMMHAINSSGSPFPKPCIYCQLDSEDMCEVGFCPSSKERLQDMYKAFCTASELNPPDEEGLEDSGDFYFNEAEVEENLLRSIEQQAAAAGAGGHGGGGGENGQMNGQSFEDAEEEGEEEGEEGEDDTRMDTEGDQ